MCIHLEQQFCSCILTYHSQVLQRCVQVLVNINDSIFLMIPPLINYAYQGVSSKQKENLSKMIRTILLSIPDNISYLLKCASSHSKIAIKAILLSLLSLILKVLIKCVYFESLALLFKKMLIQCTLLLINQDPICSSKTDLLPIKQKYTDFWLHRTSSMQL